MKMMLNEELKGIELYFEEVPTAEVREELKNAGYRWHKVKKCWYAKQSEKTVAIAQELSGNVKPEIASKTTATLWERCQTAEIPEHSYRLSTKEIAEQTRKHIKERFPEIKFSCRIGSGGWASANEVNFYFKSAPFGKDTAYFEAISNYVKAWLWSFNYDNSDLMTDYFDRGFYEYIGTWDFEATEATTEQLADMADFDKRAEEAKQAEEARQQAEFESWQKEQEEARMQAEIRRQKEEAEKALINAEVNVIEVDNKYIVTGTMLCGCGKENNLEDLKEYGRTAEESALIKREIHFTTEANYNAFCNMFMHSWTFLEGCGGTGTLDKRVDDDNYQKLNAEQRESVRWILWDCVAVYLNNELKLIIDPEGYSYARYVNIIDGAFRTELLTDAEKAEEETERDSFYMPEAIQTQSEAVESGEKYTLIYNDPWLMCATMHHITINSITKTTYAQYKDAVLIRYTERGKRKEVSHYFHNSMTMILFEGWLEAVPDEMIKKPIGGNLYEVRNAGMTSHEFIKDCLKYYSSIGHEAVINTLQY